MKRNLFCFVIVSMFVSGCVTKSDNKKLQMAMVMEKSLTVDLLEKWYPQSVDTAYGGFLSRFSYDFKPTGDQDKMIVSQARHTWTNAKASQRFPLVSHYKTSAKHGFLFLKTIMWDNTYGGFYTLVDRQGNIKGDSTKTAYGNAFGMYALAAYYASSKDTSALDLAKKSFAW